MPNSILWGEDLDRDCAQLKWQEREFFLPKGYHDDRCTKCLNAKENSNAADHR